VPDIPEVASEQSGAAMPRSMPGTLLSESSRRMSSRTTPALPVTGTSRFRCSDMMARLVAAPSRSEQSPHRLQGGSLAFGSQSTAERFALLPGLRILRRGGYLGVLRNVPPVLATSRASADDPHWSGPRLAQRLL